jgi:hypothetical protein
MHMVSDMVIINRLAEKLKLVRAIQQTLVEILRHVEGAMSQALDAQLQEQLDLLARFDVIEDAYEEDDNDEEK